MKRRARCIAMDPNGNRCCELAAKRTGDLYCCKTHARLLYMAMLEERVAPDARRMLAFSQWATACEAQRLIHALRRRKAATA